MSSSSPDAKKLKTFEKLIISNSDNVFIPQMIYLNQLKNLTKIIFFPWWCQS